MGKRVHGSPSGVVVGLSLCKSIAIMNIAQGCPSHAALMGNKCRGDHQDSVMWREHDLLCRRS